MPDRILRDELLTSERYWSVSIQAQQLFVHLILCVDDAARFSGKNFTLRASCFPGRPIESSELERMLSELVDSDLVRVYTVGSERYVFLPRFNNRRRYVASSKYPTPPNEINDLPLGKSALSHPQVNPKSSPSQEGRGRRGVGEGKREARGSRLPHDFIPDMEFALKESVDKPQEQFENFKDYWIAQPGQKGVKLDWQATWRKWCRNSRKAKPVPNGWEGAL
jgi:hypothetical protein